MFHQRESVMRSGFGLFLPNFWALVSKQLWPILMSFDGSCFQATFFVSHRKVAEKKKISQSRRQWRGSSSLTTRRRKRGRWRWKGETMDPRSFSCWLTIFSSLYSSASFVSSSSRYWAPETYIGLVWTRKAFPFVLIALFYELRDVVFFFLQLM